jgi:hypothetical protein
MTMAKMTVQKVAVTEIEVENLTGKRFGKLIVLDQRKSGSARKGAIKTNIMWLCRCDCGKEKWAQMPGLKTGNITSCGCSRISPENRDFYQSTSRPENRMIAKYIDAARSKKRKWHLKYDEMMKLFTSPCFYCGEKAEMSKNRCGPYNGIDRVDNAVGYVPGNVVSCCMACNRAKSDRNIAAFKDWIQKVHIHFVQNQSL